MSENPKPNETEETKQEPEIIVNDYGETKDPAVVVEEADRTVLLTEQETIVIEKNPMISAVPKNRPRKIYGGMWGVSEIAAVGLGMLALLSVILLYMFLVLPKQRELEANRAKRDKLEQDFISANQKYGSITTTEKRVAELITSVEDFETLHLRPILIGKSAIYQQINGLIAANGLTNTSGPNYAVLEINTQSNNGQQAAKESGRAKFQSLFPGDYVTMTLEGPYQNLRRFIKQIETSNQFIVISTIQIEPAESEDKNNSNQQVAQQQQNQPQPNDAGRINYQNPTIQTEASPKPKVPRGKNHGEIVSLRIEMAAYYRRPNFVPRDANSEQ